MIEISEELNFAPCGYLELAIAGEIININQTFVDLLSYQNRSDVIGKHVETLLTIAGRMFYQTHFFPLLKLQEKVSEIFFTLKCNNNDRLQMICNAVVRKGKPEETIQCIFVPVTERGKYEQELLNARKNAEAALEKSIELNEAKKELEINSISLDRKIMQLKHINEDIAQFSKSVSHDLQEPIRKIAVFTDKVLRENRLHLQERSIKDFEKIAVECSNLRNLVTYLERFISLNTQIDDVELLDIREIISKSYHKAQVQYNTDEIEFVLGNIPTFIGYRNQLENLFYHLLGNAIRFKSADRSLLLKVEGGLVEQNTFKALKDKYRYAKFCKITISDNGRGFTITDKNSVFQLHKSLNNDGRSLGFGLALSKKIVENHHGTISATSTANGTTITIMIPVDHLTDN